MKWNLKKLKKQIEFFYSWREHKGRAVIEAVTGFGKTIIAIIAIRKMNKKRPDNKTIVVVPNTKLHEDWVSDKGYINKFNLLNVTVFVVNSYTQHVPAEGHICDLLILDEAHRYSNEESQYFSTVLDITRNKNGYYPFIMCLSATLSDEQKEFFRKFGLKVCAVLGEAEAEREGFIATSVTYNLALDISLDDREYIKRHDNIIDFASSKFEGNIDIIRGCSISAKARWKGRTGAQWVKMWANNNQHGLNENDVKKYAHQFNNSVKERKDFLYNNEYKVEAVEELIRKYKVPTIIFSESVYFADKIYKRNPNICKAYHSKVKSEIVYRGKTVAFHVKGDTYYLISTGDTLPYKEIKRIYKGCTRLSSDKVKSKIISDFNDGQFHGLSTVSSLDEGFDSDIIELVIIASSTSTERKEIQRRGRGLRKKGDKVTTIVNLYIAETQDELWLNRRQNSISKHKIKNINRIEDIKLANDGVIKYDLTD